MSSKSMLLVKGFETEVRTPERQDEKNKLEALQDSVMALLQEVKALRNSPPVNLKEGINFYQEVEHFEMWLIQSALELTGGNQARAARLLGLKLTTLNTMIKRFNISLSVIAHARPHQARPAENQTEQPEP